MEQRFEGHPNAVRELQVDSKTEQREAHNASFDTLAAWAQSHEGTRHGREEWEAQPMLAENATLPEGAQWEARRANRDGAAVIDIVIFDGERIADAYEFAKSSPRA